MMTIYDQLVVVLDSSGKHLVLLCKQCNVRAIENDTGLLMVCPKCGKALVEWQMKEERESALKDLLERAKVWWR
jgi:transcription initiation factor IIE alpha subunit